MRPGVAVVAAALAVTGLAAGCSRGDGDEAARLELDGRAWLRGSDDGDRLVEGGTHDLEAGQTVEVVDGRGILDLPGDARIELREGLVEANGRARPDSRLRIADVPALLAGDALLVVDDGAGRIEVDGTTLRLPGGAARVSRTSGAAFAVYEGAGQLRSAGRRLEGGLPALRQAVVPGAGLLPLAPRPLRYDAHAPDPWDRRFLGAAIDLGIQLDQRSQGFTASLRPDFDADASFFEAILPGLAEEPFGARLLDADRSPGETLVGAGIALLGERASFTARWRDVFELRDDGAAWGLVALEHGVDRAAVLGTVDDAVDRSPLLFAGPPSRTVVGGDGTSPGDGTTPPTTPPPTTPPPTAPPPTTPPGPGPEPPDDPGPIPDPVPDPIPILPLPPEVEDPLEELLGGLTGPLLDVTAETVDGVVGTGDGLGG